MSILDVIINNVEVVLCKKYAKKVVSYTYRGEAYRYTTVTFDTYYKVIKDLKPGMAVKVYTAKHNGYVKWTTVIIQDQPPKSAQQSENMRKLSFTLK